MIVVGSSLHGRRCIVVDALSSMRCRRCVVVVALSSLRAITFVSTPLRSVPTHIHRPYSARRANPFVVAFPRRREGISIYVIILIFNRNYLYMWK
jgi:hypothetical protein